MLLPLECTLYPYHSLNTQTYEPLVFLDKIKAPLQSYQDQCTVKLKVLTFTVVTVKMLTVKIVTELQIIANSTLNVLNLICKGVSVTFYQNK